MSSLRPNIQPSRAGHRQPFVMKSISGLCSCVLVKAKRIQIRIM